MLGNDSTWSVLHYLFSQPHGGDSVDFYDDFSWKYSCYVYTNYCHERDFYTGHVFAVL